MATFITSKAVGETITIIVEASTPMTQGSNYWKYNHNGVDSAVFPNGEQTITVANANGEFTLIPCLSDGTVSGDITLLYAWSNELTSFDGTGLTGLQNLDLSSNLLTSFDGTGLTGLQNLWMNNNQFTSFDPTGLSSLTFLGLGGNQLTSFDGTDLTSLTILTLFDNLLTSFNGTGLTSLTELYLERNQLTSFDPTGLNVLQYLYIDNNPFTNPTSTNNSLLAKLAANELANDWDSGEFSTTGGRTSAGTADYNYLLANGWQLGGLDLTGGNGGVNIYGKLRIKGATTIGGGVTPPLWDGGTIYNIGAVVTFNNQTWNCIQYAPAGYGPFGGYVNVYWTL